MKLKLLVGYLFFAYPVFTQEWQQIGNFNGAVIRLFTDTVDNLLYVGGVFRFNGTDTVNAVCIWDNNAILPMGNGLYDACGDPLCQSPGMFIRYKDEIYAGSYFDEIAGQPSSGIARWNGSQWLPVSPGLIDDSNDPGYAGGFYEHDGLLYTVGYFRWAGPDTANSVASWNGTAWQTYGTPEDTQHDLPILTRTVFYKGELYVGGNSYNFIDGNFNQDIMRYDGTAWHQVGSGLYGGSSFINDMVIYHDELYICGYFRGIDGNAGNKIMRWNGEAWHDVGGGLCSPSALANDMLVFEDKLYLVGNFTCVGDGVPANSIAVWDGTHWCSIGNSTFDNTIGCIEIYNHEIYVGGGFTEVGGYAVNRFAKYIGDHSTDTCSATVSVTIEPQQAWRFAISPNPVKDQITISVSNIGLLSSAWRIFNAAGQEVTVLVHPVSTTEKQLVLQVQGLQVGIYYLQWVGPAHIETAKFVKM